MDDDSQLGQFEQELSAIVGDALARELVVYAHRPNPLEKELLRNDGLMELSDDQRSAVLNLIDRYF